MLLADYLTTREISIPDFAKLVERSPEGVRLWVKGQRMPGTSDIVKIYEITSGAVCANDLHAACVAHQQTRGALEGAVTEIVAPLDQVTEAQSA